MAETKINDTPGCAAGLVHENEIATLKGSDKLQWDAIEKLQNRLPVWATLLLTLMGGVVGWSLTYAAMTAKFAVMASKVTAGG